MAWRQAIIWTNADRVHWRIYAALGGDELTRANIILQLCDKDLGDFDKLRTLRSSDSLYVSKQDHQSAKTKDRQFDNCVVTGGTVSCRYDN